MTMISTQDAVKKLVDGFCAMTDECHRMLYREALESLVRLAQAEKIAEIRVDYATCKIAPPQAYASVDGSR